MAAFMTAFTLIITGKREDKGRPSSKDTCSITVEFVRERLKDGSIDLCGRKEKKRLSYVPIEVLVLLPQARKLDLCHNRIAVLPDNFSTLRHLTELDLHRNLLENLPENFGQLSNLRRLDLHGNPLKTLPHAFWQLNRLEWLDLRRNKFEKADLKAAADVGKRCTEEKGHECAKKVLNLLREEARTREMERHKITVKKSDTIADPTPERRRERRRCSDPVPSKGYVSALLAWIQQLLFFAMVCVSDMIRKPIQYLLHKPLGWIIRISERLGGLWTGISELIPTWDSARNSALKYILTMAKLLFFAMVCISDMIRIPIQYLLHKPLGWIIRTSERLGGLWTGISELIPTWDSARNSALKYILTMAKLLFFAMVCISDMIRIPIQYLHKLRLEGYLNAWAHSGTKLPSLFQPETVLVTRP